MPTRTKKRPTKSKSKATTPKRKSAKTSKVAANMTWNQKLEWLLQDYLKRTKAKGRLSLLTVYGDLLGEAKGKAEKLNLDWTSVGSLSASLKSVAEGLAGLLKTKAGPVWLGEDSKKGSWILSLQNDWLLLGIRAPYMAKLMKPIEQHLKSKKQVTTREDRSSGQEALDGLNEASIDTALRRES